MWSSRKTGLTKSEDDASPHPFAVIALAALAVWPRTRPQVSAGLASSWPACPGRAGSALSGPPSPSPPRFAPAEAAVGLLLVAPTWQQGGVVQRDL